MLIEPFYCLPVLISGTGHHPNDKLSFFSRSVSDDLSQMIMIGIFELVFNNNLTSAPDLLRKYICAEASDTRLGFY